MITKKILEMLGGSKKSYFTMAELSNYLNIKKTTLKVVLSRLIKQKKIIRLVRGYYSLSQKTPDLEQFAVELNYPSYISLEYALAISGILSQVPAGITLITAKRSVAYNVMGTMLEYTHLKSNLFFGYKIVKQTQIARPEKALLDELYLIGLKKRTLDLRELNLKGLNKKLFNKWLKCYPPSTVKLANKLGL